MKKKILWCLAFFLLSMLFFASSKCYAADLDEIINYVVTVEPRMNDGTLDITYEITWKVLDSTTEGPLEWVQIGTPNSNFDTPTALTENIKSIAPYNGSYVRVDFTRAYKAGEQLTFKYRIHQTHMYKLRAQTCQYTFTPAWFTNAKVDNMTIKWNHDQVKSNSRAKKEGSYLVWNKESLEKGEKMTVKVKYKQSAFGYLNPYKQRKSANAVGENSWIVTAIIVMVSIWLFYISISTLDGGGYYRHRGFGGGYYGGGYYSSCVHSSCVHSSCACVHSSCASSCACACAGSGRAGCSKKDFYGTKLDKNKLKKVFQ